MLLDCRLTRRFYILRGIRASRVLLRAGTERVFKDGVIGVEELVDLVPITVVPIGAIHESQITPIGIDIMRRVIDTSVIGVADWCWPVLESHSLIQLNHAKLYFICLWAR